MSLPGRFGPRRDPAATAGEFTAVRGTEVA